MMDVEIYNGYLFDNVSVSSFSISCSHSHVIDEAESIRLSLVIALVISVECLTEYSSMMTRWSSSTEGVSKFPLCYTVNCANYSSASQESCLPRLLRNTGVLPINEFKHLVIGPL
jgi:hypothetical protein